LVIPAPAGGERQPAIAASPALARAAVVAEAGRSVAAAVVAEADRSAAGAVAVAGVAADAAGRRESDP